MSAIDRIGPVEIAWGDSPLVFSQPHAGTFLPPEMTAAMTDAARALPDTDWWIDRLYAPLVARFSATVVRTPVSRYAIDVNRDPSGASLYADRTTTGLVPRETFDGAPLWRPGMEPDEAEIARRKRLFFEPYHAALAAAIERARLRFGFCLLWDCHSIRSLVPRLFEGRLPTINLGTFDGRSCSPALRAAAERILANSAESFVIDGRFKGGWIVRHWGRPQARIEAVQMELAQRAYMEEAPPWSFVEDRAERIRALFAELVAGALEEARRLHAPGTVS
ncbi:MAG: N-formylglutamate deformylase [Geminicoccaceae bacterium]|nr:N-formylglutamate deformylase [Geminicoccaceae bacterium]MCS7267433.1 N-formylglutamate deformylase [Geminicoccaceae bacterium]MCX7630622.1 N-formylglutamate deformylase [Geminicoccaceae bacterium]MDW8125069.1 N-formylglutamate deformylase [Geminicoccaceae bacterium]MDW8342289.1 N-formylglutamate deformylase [Geminicoccaceae bacterium]